MQDRSDNSLNVRQSVPFFMVTKMESSLDFYVNGLGFDIKIKWEPNGKIEWCWLQLDNAALMLQEYQHNNLPVERPGVGVSIAFICNDALKIYRDITARGLSPDEPFVGNNMWVVGLNDPDGYRLFFESPTEVPEETTYSTWMKER